jgi:hypothetical protein
MSTRSVQLVDQSRNVLATAQVANEGEYYGGTIDLRSAPSSLHALFNKFEEIVNGQEFVFLDAVQEEIGALRIKAIFDDGSEMDIKDLQVFPSMGDVSFRPAGDLSQTAKSV